MGYFAYGSPKSYRHPCKMSSPSPSRLTGSNGIATSDGDRDRQLLSSNGEDNRVLCILPDPAGKFILTVMPGALHVWSAQQHRVVQGRFLIGKNALREEGPLVGACWAPSSAVIVAVFENGLVLFFDVQETSLREGKNSGGLLSFQVHDKEASHLPAPGAVFSVSLRRSAEARLAHYPAVATTVSSCFSGALFGTSAGHLTCMSWDAEMLWRVHVPELLRGDDALIKLGVFQLGAVQHAGSTEKLETILSPSGDDSAGGIAAITYSASVDLCGLVLGCGAAFLLSLRKGGTIIPSAVDGRWLRSEDASCITIEPRRMLATVGLDNGDIEQFYFGVPAGDVCPVMRRLTLSSWYFEPEDVGPVCVVSWTTDGCALLVGWKKRGLAVWSVSGCRLMWTLPQVGGTLPSSSPFPIDSQAVVTNNALDQGVMSAAWGPEGLYLLAAPRVTLQSPPTIAESHFMEFSFFKNTCGVSTCQSESSRLAMFGCDRIVLLRSSENHISTCEDAHYGNNYSSRNDPCMSNTSRDNQFVWQHVLIPQDYLWHNWPPKRVAVSEDALHVAVAGRHGVGLCSLKTQKWRIFGDFAHSSPHIECCALAWAGASVVIGNKIRTVSRGKSNLSFELLVFPRDQADSSEVGAQHALPAKPIIIDYRADGFLLVICEDSSVGLFKLTPSSGKLYDIAEVYRTFLPTRESRAIAAPSPSLQRNSPGEGSVDTILNSSAFTENAHDDVTKELQPRLPSPGGGIVVARIFPPLDHAERTSTADAVVAPIPTQIMLLRSTGSLILLDVRHMMSVPLLRYVEHFWYTPITEPPFESLSNRPVWWAYGDDGIHVCFREGMRRYLTSRSEESFGNGTDLDVSGAERLASMSSLAATVPERLRSSASSRSSGIGVEQWFELDPEVYPLGLLSRCGMVLGACQGLLLDAVAVDGESVPSHVIQVKRQPVLHTLLRHLLMKSESEDRKALQVALNCAGQPQFVDSLEWLLYEAVTEYDDDGTASYNAKPLGNGWKADSMVEHDFNLRDGLPSSAILRQFNRRSSRDGAGFPASPRRRRAGSSLFPRVIKLLKYFGEYEDIVVRCARKMESKSWPLLFSLAGDPLSLLDQCFTSGRLRTAACLLVILQEMRGFGASTPQSLKLITAAIARGELGLAGDLASFLGKAARAGILDSTQLEASEDVSWIAEAAKGSHVSESSSNSSMAVDPSMSRIPAIDYAVLKYAGTLLRDMEFRNLAALSVRMNFPLAAWLQRRSRLDVTDLEFHFVEDFSQTLLRLHQQFQYPEPSVSAVARCFRHTRSSNFPPNLEVSNQCGVAGFAENNVSSSSAGQKIGSIRKFANNVDSPRAFAERTHVKMFGTGADNHFGLQLPPPPSSNDSEALSGIRAKARHLCQQELIYLQAVAKKADAHDLCVVFSVLLLDVEAIVRSLTLCKGLYVPVVKALRGFGVEGYDKLADGIKFVLAIPGD